MNKFFKSSEPDLKKLYSTDSQLNIINKNILYLTHEVDKCVAMLRRMEVDNRLQTTMDEYHSGAPPDSLPEDEGLD